MQFPSDSAKGFQACQIQLNCQDQRSVSMEIDSGLVTMVIIFSHPSLLQDLMQKGEKVCATQRATNDGLAGCCVAKAISH